MKLGVLSLAAAFWPCSMLARAVALSVRHAPRQRSSTGDAARRTRCQQALGRWDRAENEHRAVESRHTGGSYWLDRASPLVSERTC